MFALLTLLILLVGLFGLFWGGSLFAQSYMYNVPAERLALRSAIGAGVMSLFFTFWVILDQRRPGTYDTIFNFSQYELQKFDEFTAVEFDRAGQERTRKYVNRIGGRRAADYLDDQGSPFKRSAADSMVVAVLVEQDGQEVRFEAPTKTIQRGEREEIRFDKPQGTPVVYGEVGGRRFMTDESIGTAFDPRFGVLMANLLLNAVHFLLWWVIFWFVLQYNWAHALGLGAACWFAFVLIFVPILLEQN